MYPVLTFNENPLLPTYIFVISMAYCISLFWAIKRANRTGFSRHLVLDYSLTLMIFGCFGARLFHVVFEYPDYYLENPIDIFLLYQGGFVFYGGFLFAFLGGYLVVKYREDNFRFWLDFFTPMIAFGYTVGRLGCFLAGCCYGKPSSLPWAMTFANGLEAPAHTPLHPTQLYLAFLGALTLLFILFLEKKKDLPDGVLFCLWLLLHSTSRFVVEPFRGDWRGEPFLSWSLSSWMSGSLILASLLGLFFCYQIHQKRIQAKCIISLESQNQTKSSRKNI